MSDVADSQNAGFECCTCGTPLDKQNRYHDEPGKNMCKQCAENPENSWFRNMLDRYGGPAMTDDW